MGSRDTDLYSLGYSLEEFGQLAEVIVRHTALSAEVMVVGRDELVELHLTEGHVTQQLLHLPATTEVT